jgi:hypothetical protein
MDNSELRWQMGLALKMGRSLSEFWNTVPGWELPLWRALYQLDPWDESRADLRAGMLASVMTSLWSNSKTKPKDFMPDFEPMQMISGKLGLAALAASLGAKVKVPV